MYFRLNLFVYIKLVKKVLDHDVRCDEQGMFILTMTWHIHIIWLFLLLTFHTFCYIFWNIADGMMGKNKKYNIVSGVSFHLQIITRLKQCGFISKEAFLCYLSNKILQHHKKCSFHCINGKKKFRSHVKAMYNLENK